MLGNKKNATPETAPQDENVRMPLFFTSPHVISVDRHAEAKLRNNITLSFAAGTNSIPLTLADIPEAAKYYPIAFTQEDTSIPVAIVGLEQANYYVDDKGAWLENHYVPSYVRKYPFVFMEMPGSDQLTLCIDESVLVFDPQADGAAIFEDNKPSAFTNSALEFCAAYQDQYVMTNAFCAAIKEKELLTPQRSNVELANSRPIQLGGFQLVDVEKFRALDKDTVNAWHQNGFLSVLYYVMQSQSNWRFLLDLANKAEK